MGRVLFQRYMHPTRYRSKYKELYDWMKAFADEPGANRIYRLAKRAAAFRLQVAAAPLARAEPPHRGRARPGLPAAMRAFGQAAPLGEEDPRRDPAAGSPGATRKAPKPG